MTETISIDDILTSADVARLLNLTPGRVRQLAEAGHLPHRRTTSGVRVFRRGDVERLAQERAARRETQR